MREPGRDAVKSVDARRRREPGGFHNASQLFVSIRHAGFISAGAFGAVHKTCRRVLVYSCVRLCEGNAHRVQCRTEVTEQYGAFTMKVFCDARCKLHSSRWMAVAANAAGECDGGSADCYTDGEPCVRFADWCIYTGRAVAIVDSRE